MKIKRFDQSISIQRMRVIEHEAVTYFGISEIILMENAGRSISDYALLLMKKKKLSSVVVVTGSGNNGGDGLVAARHISNRGFPVKIFIAKSNSSFKDLCAKHLEIIKKMRLPFLSFQRLQSALSRSTLVIDALFGIGLRGAVDSAYTELIELINSSSAAVLSVDIPSGLDADTGCALGTAVKANMTVTMTAPKKGMLTSMGKKYCGKIVIADIGIPIRQRLSDSAIERLSEHIKHVKNFKTSD